MTITYIFHSCYVIEFEEFSLIFDYFKDITKPDGTYWINDYLLGKNTPLYVLSTHSHTDHFNPEILSWKEKKSDITYIFSEELQNKFDLIEDNVHFLKKFETYQDKNIFVQAFGSTDAGGSFALRIEDTTIFHAGDLNNWHWRNEVSKKESCIFENNFLCELELLAEYYDEFTISMFPIDPRLGEDYLLGAEQFISRIDSEYILPMHFGEDFEKANAIKQFAEENSSILLPVTHKGQSFEIE